MNMKEKNKYNDAMTELQSVDVDVDEVDDSLRAMFAEYQPGIATDLDFMTRLQERLDTVEYIRQEMARRNRSRKWAFAAALLTGFISGILFSFAIPYLQGIFAGIPTAMSSSIDLSLTALMLPWAAAGIIIIALSLSAYSLTFSLSARKS